MTIGRLIPLIPVFVALASQSAYGWKPARNHSYVTSYLDGVFFIKAVPDAQSVNGGKTTVLRVGGDSDRVEDVYGWYDRNPKRIEIAWSPIAGKVALMHLRIEEDSPHETGEMQGLDFYLGGKPTRSYDRKQLDELKLPASVGYWKDIPLESRQIPGSNDYVFILRAAADHELVFDILSGELKNDARK